MINVSNPTEVTCVVVGAGPAGFGAAFAAARDGCDVLLVERHGFVGGMGTAAGLNSYINYHYEGRDLSESVYRMLREQMLTQHCGYIGQGTNVDFYDIEALKYTMESEYLRCGGRLLYHSVLVSAVRETDFWNLQFACKGSLINMRARYVIDATGDADACALAGAAMTHGRKSDGLTQPMSMVVHLGGFDPDKWKSAGNELVHGRYATCGDCFTNEIVLARELGEWSIPRESVAMWWAMPSDPTQVGVNGTRILGLNSCSAWDITAAEVEGRRQARELAAFFKKYIPGFEHAYLLATGPQVGVRESRRIIGRQTLHEHDVIMSRCPEDSIVFCSYPIDIHNPNGHGTDFEPKETDFLYGIPYECLLPEGLENIIAAGRCISATHEAAGSFRVMATCMALGEAAGAAVALAQEKGAALHMVPASAIRMRLDQALQEG